MRISDSDEITRAYFDSVLVVPSYIDGDIADTGIELFGYKFDTPIMTAALSHLNSCENAMVEFAKGACQANALHFMGMGEDSLLEDITKVNPRSVKIIKPHEDDNEVIRRIRHAKVNGVIAVGMDIDHAISSDGKFDNVYGLKMAPKTTGQLARFVEEADEIPFVVKGVLSVEDAIKSKEIGAGAIILSHHHGIMTSMVPPLMMLPSIREAVGDDIKIFVDCGFMSGMDVYKALALGADAVGVGRALIGPLSQGAKGVSDKIDQMNNELKCVMSRTGAKTLNDISMDSLRFTSF